MNKKITCYSYLHLGQLRKFKYIWNMRVTVSIYRGPYMSANVLLSLLNELGKRDKM